MSKPLRIATRGSKLALWQSHYVANKLKQLGAETELVIIKTSGDKIQDRFLHEFGGKGLFVKELEKALAEGEADLAVHSLKDLPAQVLKPFTLTAILKRHSPGDVVIFAKDHGLPANTGKDHLAKLAPLKVGTASLRRQSLLKQVKPVLSLQAVRGNVDTRIKKLEEGTWDAIILAHAAIERLGFTGINAHVLDPKWFVPAPAQGALAIETLTDHPACELIAKLDDASSRKAVTTERLLLKALGGDCSMPIGCYVSFHGSDVSCDSVVLDYEGHDCRFTLKAPGATPAEKLVEQILSGLRSAGLDKILATLAKGPPDLGPIT